VDSWSPDEAIYADITNRCESDVLVAVNASSGAFQGYSGVGLMYPIDSGATDEDFGPVLTPLSDNLYLWVVEPDATDRGEPYALPVASLASRVENSWTVYTIEIVGELCP
jgi:hypothetical protein